MERNEAPREFAVIEAIESASGVRFKVAFGAARTRRGPQTTEAGWAELSQPAQLDPRVAAAVMRAFRALVRGLSEVDAAKGEMASDGVGEGPSSGGKKRKASLEKK